MPRGSDAAHWGLGAGIAAEAGGLWALRTLRRANRPLLPDVAFAPCSTWAPTARGWRLTWGLPPPRVRVAPGAAGTEARDGGLTQQRRVLSPSGGPRSEISRPRPVLPPGLASPRVWCWGDLWRPSAGSPIAPAPPTPRAVSLCTSSSGAASPRTQAPLHLARFHLKTLSHVCTGAAPRYVTLRFQVAVLWVRPPGHLVSAGRVRHSERSGPASRSDVCRLPEGDPAPRPRDRQGGFSSQAGAGVWEPRASGRRCGRTR